jgi:NAD(P)H dehydrogenase (quinone)
MLEKIFVTGASGQLGHLVIDSLLKSIPASQVVAGARNTDKADDLAARGVEVCKVDYEEPETLKAAFTDIDKVLLISSSEIGRRAPQHLAVIDAAKKASVKLLAYTSVLHADSSVLGLADEHRQTEQALINSGIPYVILRNGWYTENYAASVPMAVEHDAFLGSAGNGRISSAARQDYAEAAAAVLLSGKDQAGKIYELAGDNAYTLSELAAEVTRQSGKNIVYKNMPEEAYRNVLVEAGLPEPLAALLADSDTGASKGALFDNSGTLSQLTGHPTTPLADTISATLKN